MQKVIVELADAIGMGDAIEVCRRWGGRELNVPEKVEPCDPLALALGLEPARKLVSAFGGTRLQFPIERHALLDFRNEAIWRDYDDGRGLSHTKLGLRYGLTRQGATAVIKKMRAAYMQRVTGANSITSQAESGNAKR